MMRSESTTSSAFPPTRTSTTCGPRSRNRATVKKVAIIGGGPAGLTCAYYLTLEGYEPTVFEALPELGGMLRYGIPEYRLPKAILDKEIKWITDLGVDVHTNTKLGRDITLDGSLNKATSRSSSASALNSPRAWGLPMSR